jgi:hypothetical protein
MNTSMASSLSSFSSVSSSNVSTIGSPTKGGRVWDPARRVELFKRGSEEVLAKFLKGGSGEDGVATERHRNHEENGEVSV